MRWKEIAIFYIETLLFGFDSIERTNHYELERDERLEHCRWMCEQISEMVDEDTMMRWICFVQGVLWCYGLREISEMREDNRS